MPKVSQEHLDARRSQVLEAAVHCFARDGFQSTTIADIAAKAGLSHGAIYRYFPSKEDIVEAIAQERQEQREAINERAATASRVREALNSLIAGHFAFVTSPEERRRVPLTVQLWGEAIRNPRIRRILRRAGKAHHELLGRLLREGQEQDEVRQDIRPEAAAALLVATFQGYTLQIASGFDVASDDYTKVVEAAIDGLLTPYGRGA